MINEIYMQRCIDLAQNGRGRVAPNPMVGAVLVHDGKIIGEGIHLEYGQAHAEVNAIKDAEKKYKIIPENSILYVNLEPCSHHGKTPPCADLIIRKGIRNVIIGTKDPNPLVQGKGIEKLKFAGCEVHYEILKNECRELNKTFYKFYEKHRPYIILKWAQSSDGFISSEHTNNSDQMHWISNEYSRKLSHKWRSETQAIIVGTNTALHDNPSLNVRDWEGKNPIRIAFDKDLKLPKHLHLFDQSTPTLIFTQKKTSSNKNLEYINIDFNNGVIKEVLNGLYKRGIQSMIVEGGTTLLNSFINENLWDEARIFIADKILIKGIKAPAISGSLIKEDQIENDLLLVYKRLEY
jgi:diaminohydroxyphosphoribosylaminopyrimidine deaminase/5-amino-6-(5-phosphoribosylamino)uracil reductase